MRVLHINWSGGHGGTERFTCQLALEQQKRGILPVVCYLADPGVFGRTLEEAQVKVVPLQAKSGWNPSVLWRLIRLIETARIDIIHNHDGPLGSVAALFHRRVPLLVHVHGTPLGPSRWQPWRRIASDRLLRKRIFRFIANSNHTALTIAGHLHVPASRVDVIPCAIDTTAFTPTTPREVVRRELKLQPEHFVVGAVARLHRQKGLDMFLRIAARVHARDPDIRFVIAGDGPEWEALHQLAESLELTEVVRFLGGRDDIPDVLSALDVFAMSSRWEPFGITLLEAMASHVPVVTFAIDGVLDIAGENTAFLIDRENEEKFADTLLAIRRQRVDVAQRVANAFERVQTFNIRAIERRVFALYNEAVQGDHAKALRS